jgi:hypothetical protein
MEAETETELLAEVETETERRFLAEQMWKRDFCFPLMRNFHFPVVLYSLSSRPST